MFNMDFKVLIGGTQGGDRLEDTDWRRQTGGQRTGKIRFVDKTVVRSILNAFLQLDLPYIEWGFLC